MHDVKFHYGRQSLVFLRNTEEEVDHGRFQGVFELIGRLKEQRNIESLRNFISIISEFEIGSLR
jgi:hypothetical protein